MAALLGRFWKAAHLTTQLHPWQGSVAVDLKLGRHGCWIIERAGVCSHSRPDQIFGRDYQAGVPVNALPPWQKPGGNIVSLLTKIGFRCAVWMLTFCAVLISPVILIYGVPVAIGVVTDVTQSGLGPIATVLMADAAAWQQIRQA